VVFSGLMQKLSPLYMGGGRADPFSIGERREGTMGNFGWVEKGWIGWWEACKRRDIGANQTNHSSSYFGTTIARWR
jgi:hypothetical protein